MRILDPKMAPTLQSPPSLSLRLFGPFVVTVHGKPMPKIRSQKEHWLLALLALRAPAPLERSWLAATLWSETTDESARYNLRRNLRLLRDALGPEAGRLRAPTPRTLRLDLDGAECDVTAFDNAIRRADPASLAEAAALYTGPLLLGCPEEWAFPEREAREWAVLAALETLAAGARDRGDWADAAAHLRRALEIDPLRETALRALLEALAAQGSPAAATDAYRTFRRRVRDELNVELDPETIAVYRRIQEDGRRHTSPEPSYPAPPRDAAHLPTPLTTLIGRAGEITALVEALKRSRLVTLTGPGGVGKTRLALAVAHALHDGFKDGAWFADIAPLTDPNLLTAALITTFGLREGPGRTLTEVLAEFLRDRQLLLVLDNCEHLASACAHLALGLLRACPALRILATSREPLRMSGEAAWPVPGLPASDAARLFMERAAQSNPAFRLTTAGEVAVADICRRLDGIPLAIEMAAARTRALPLPQIAARLDDAFRLLSEPGGDLLPRHQTLRATLDWSYALLSEAEQTLLARLSVFAGGWTLEAAEAVCADLVEDSLSAGIKPESVLSLLAGLVDKSLVVYKEQADGTGRYRFLETVRQYADDRLTERGEVGAVQERAASWFLGLAEQAEAQLTGPEQGTWLARLEAEHDNLRAALARLRESADHLRLAGALARFWFVRGHLSEGRAHLGAALARDPAGAAPGDRLKVVMGAADLAQRQGDFAEARRLSEQALLLARAAGDQSAVAALLGAIGGLLNNQGDYVGARAAFEEALALAQERGDRAGEVGCRAGLGFVAREQGAYAEARGHLEEAARISRDLGDALSLSSVLGNLAWLAAHQGDHDEAGRLFGQTLAIYHSLGNRLGEAWVLSSLASVQQGQGDVGAARALLEQALSLNRAVGNRAGESWNLSELGALLVKGGGYAEAETTLRQALEISHEIGQGTVEARTLFHLGRAAAGQGVGDAQAWYAKSLRRMRDQGMAGISEVLIALAERWAQGVEAARAVTLLAALEGAPSGEQTPARQRARNQAAAACRAVLGDVAFDSAWADGRVLGWEQAVVYALSEE